MCIRDSDAQPALDQRTVRKCGAKTTFTTQTTTAMMMTQQNREKNCIESRHDELVHATPETHIFTMKTTYNTSRHTHSSSIPVQHLHPSSSFLTDYRHYSNNYYCHYFPLARFDAHMHETTKFSRLEC